MDDRVQWLIGKSVAVVGISVSTVPLIRYLVSLGVEVTACDRKGAEELGERHRQVAALPIALRLGPAYLNGLEEFEVIFLSPGIKRHQPPLEAARRAGAHFYSDTELFFDLCPAPIIAITGSAGKTTTTTLVGEMMKRAGHVTHVLGNIGNPLFGGLPAIRPGDKVVLELSSFQLMPLRRSPHLALVTNLSPNHLDYHADMAEYVAAKTNIYRHQGAGDRVVLNYDNQITREMAVEAGDRVVFFSRCSDLPEGACLVDGELAWRMRGHEERVLPASELIIPGQHNVENALAATALASLAGADISSIRQVLASFRGVEHRLELVRELDGVKYYNDSIGTAPDRTLAALDTLPDPLVLILGGSDKKSDFAELAAAVVEKARAVILCGQTASRLREALAAADPSGRLEVIECSDYPEVVATARRLARPGEIVLLSPACPSFDRFTNFEERGRVFKDLVNALGVDG
ncbi:MAG: UDP-N-acetylmuramoyl-L-alanine--D-glutamate ligase [Bacillota bacterium]